ncbi:class I SAM-dependent methyltransferase [Polynucleobacter paneuropaeus]|nr:class I SAM-dependent methyltransferase [Polynucleobacter paneuropaeus]
MNKNNFYRYKICSKESYLKFIVHLPKFLFGVSAKIYKCVDCRVGVTIPPPKVSVEYYENNYEYDESFHKKNRIHQEYADKLMCKFEAFLPKGAHLLDFGSGGGFLLSAAKANGYIGEGVEANQILVKRCWALGLDVTQKSIDDLIAENKKFDLIIFSAVLEHLEDPVSMLQKSTQLLSSVGMIAVIQANYYGLLPRLFPWCWYGWQPKEHYWHFNSSSLIVLGDMAALKQIKKIDDGLFHPWFFGLDMKQLIARNLAAIISRLGLWLGLGDNLIVICKKNTSAAKCT